MAFAVFVEIFERKSIQLYMDLNNVDWSMKFVLKNSKIFPQTTISSKSHIPKLSKNSPFKLLAKYTHKNLTGKPNSKSEKSINHGKMFP